MGNYEKLHFWYAMNRKKRNNSNFFFFNFFGSFVSFCNFSILFLEKRFRKPNVPTDAEISLHTLLLKYYNDLLGRQSSQQAGMKLHSSMWGTFFVYTLTSRSKYANFQEKIFATISGKKFQTFNLRKEQCNFICPTPPAQNTVYQASHCCTLLIGLNLFRHLYDCIEFKKFCFK